MSKIIGTLYSTGLGVGMGAITDASYDAAAMVTHNFPVAMTAAYGAVALSFFVVLPAQQSIAHAIEEKLKLDSSANSPIAIFFGFLATIGANVVYTQSQGLNDIHMKAVSPAAVSIDKDALRNTLSQGPAPVRMQRHPA